MFDGIILNAVLIVFAVGLIELIKLIVRKTFKKVDEAVSKTDFDELKKTCQECQKQLPREYVLYSRYKEDIDKQKEEHKNDLLRIWNKLDELMKLYYEG